MLKAILAVALLGQLEMNVELQPGDLDQLPELQQTKPKPRQFSPSERAAARARIAAQKAEKYQRFLAARYYRGAPKAAARRARLAAGYPSPYAQRLQGAYAQQVYQHGRAMGYIRPSTPSCSPTRASILGYRY